MSITTHEKIRVESGFQNNFVKQEFLNSPDGLVNTFYVKTDDNVKFVPNFNLGGTVAGISDVKVWLGLSGVLGVSQVGISGIDINAGSIMLKVKPDSGCSLTVEYASSPLSSDYIEEKRLWAESVINQRLSICYDLPLNPYPASIISLATRLASAFILMRNYGMGTKNVATDGFELYKQLMGTNRQSVQDNDIGNVGEIGMICTPLYQIVDDSGNIIARNDDGRTYAGGGYLSGGRVEGTLYDITEEEFRFKKPQLDADAEQPGSAKTATEKIQT